MRDAFFVKSRKVEIDKISKTKNNPTQLVKKKYHFINEKAFNIFLFSYTYTGVLHSNIIKQKKIHT